MSELVVRIEALPPMRVISAYGFGAQPEDIAAEKMEAFLRKKGLLEAYGSTIPHYGFNNPSPSSGSPNYGYEIWVVVPPEVAPEDDLREVQFAGGLYAVTRFEGLDHIGQVWGELVAWRENSPYRHGHHQWLEHLLNPLESDTDKYIFELYLPIKDG
jgi:DNA gyrase inhibitor GyrI